jgi:hypothetical protein
MDAGSVDAPAYDDIATHADLIAWSRGYCRDVRREWAVDVRFDLVEWEVSTRAKRRAAAVKRPRIPAASVGDRIDWDEAVTADGQRADGRPLPCTVSLTWDAFAAFDRPAWESTLRHELIHVEQYQFSGTTGHGPAFRRRAERLDTSVHCETFADPEYTLCCDDCGSVVAHRYRECKLVRRRDEYRSECCGASLRLAAGNDH